MIIMREEVFSVHVSFSTCLILKFTFLQSEENLNSFPKGLVSCAKNTESLLLPRLIVSLFTNILDEVRSSDKSRNVFTACYKMQVSQAPVSLLVTQPTAEQASLWSPLLATDGLARWVKLLHPVPLSYPLASDSRGPFSCQHP